MKKISDGKRGKKKKMYTTKGNCQVGLWQRYYMDGVTNGTTMSTGVEWTGIGENGRERSWGESMDEER